jgi:hypothetical protein
MKALKVLIIVLLATFSFSAVNAQDYHHKPIHHKIKHRKPVYHKKRKPDHRM